MLWLGTSLEDGPRYTPITTFEIFPFLDWPSPDFPANEYAGNPPVIAIGGAARQLVKLHNR